MPIDEEQPEFALEIKEEAQRGLHKLVASSQIGGLLHHAIPIIGPAVVELMTDLAIQRTNRRMYEMFEYFTEKVVEIGETKVDREWFQSEEFQNLLFDAFLQLNLTHDRKKIEMLGVALANSGAPGFKEEDRKDLFVRFVREITPHHLKVLLELAPQPAAVYDFPAITPDTRSFPVSDLKPCADPDEKTLEWLRWNRRPIRSPKGDDLLALQMLLSYGLVEEEIKSSIQHPGISHISSEGQAREAVRQFIKNVENARVKRSFRISPLGDKFLKFVGLPKT